MLFIVVMEELDAISAAALAPDVNIEGDKPGAEVKDRDVRTTPREMTVARFVYDTFLANERFAVEKGFHDQMRESWRICRSEPDSKERAKLAQLGLPGDITDSTTEVRRFAALSQLKEIFASSGQFPCKLSSTSSPDVPEFVTAQALQVMIDELTAVIAEAGAVPDDAAVAQFGRDRMKELLNTAKEHANDEIELLERRVRDDFEEANFLDAFNLGMEYLTTYGSALWEGPVPCVRWKNEFGGSDGTKIFRKAQASVAFRAVNPLDVYPSPDQTNVEDGPICIKIRIAPQELWLNAKEAKGASAEKDGVWFTDTVSDLLAKYPTGGVRLSWQDGDEQNRMLRGQSCWTADASCMMEGISYYGQLKGNLLLRMGVTKSHDGTKIDPGDYYEVNAIVIDDYCVYCRIINPCMGRPLCKAQFYDSPDNFFGNSIAQRLIAYQRILNACLPALVVNMNMTCAPIAWVSDASRLLDKTPNALKLQGGKVIAFKGQVAGVSVQSGPPMGTLRIDSQVDQILGVMKAVLQRVEDVSGIPSYTYGQNVTGGAGRTYSGLAMLTEAANRVMKMIIDGLDRGVIRRLVKMTAYFHMMYDDKVAYTGDVEVVPTGVMGLILKQQEMQKVLQLMQMVANNQALVQLVGGRGLMELFRQVLETYDIANIDKIIPSKKELDLREFVALAQKNAGGAEFQTAPQGVQSNAQPGQMRPPQNLGDEYAGNGGGQQETYMRNDTEYRMPQESNPGSAGERRGAA
jgi:hypothetical protein